MNDIPDLTAAEDIVTGRAEAVVTEWGIRSGASGRVWEYGTDEQRARKEQPLVYGGGTLIRRTVTYGPWEPVPDAP